MATTTATTAIWKAQARTRTSLQNGGPFIAFPGHAGRCWTLLGWRLVARLVRRGSVPSGASPDHAGRARRLASFASACVARSRTVQRSAVRRRVLQPTLGPQGVEAAVLDADRRQVVGEDLAVVADLGDDLQGEVRRQAETRVERRAVGTG